MIWYSPALPCCRPPPEPGTDCLKITNCENLCENYVDDHLAHTVHPKTMFHFAHCCCWRGLSFQQFPLHWSEKMSWRQPSWWGGFWSPLLRIISEVDSKVGRLLQCSGLEDGNQTFGNNKWLAGLLEQDPGPPSLIMQNTTRIPPLLAVPVPAWPVLRGGGISGGGGGGNTSKLTLFPHYYICRVAWYRNCFI